MPPRVSVLLPTHNRADVLHLAVASVLAQSESNFELLVVGDGCTDHTADVVAGFNDPRIRWFDLPKAPHFGYANRNIALRQAKGEYIAFMAHDDLIFPDHLALLAATLEASGAEWVYSRPLWVTLAGFVIPFASNLLNADELDTFLTVRNHIPAANVLHRRSCLEKYGYWPEDVPSAADWRFWVRIIKGGNRTNIGYCPTPTALHFHAIWKVRPDQVIRQVAAACEIIPHAPWWPSTMRVPIAPGSVEQETFYGLIRGGDYVDALRRDVTRVIERLAWMQIDNTAGPQTRLQADIERARAALKQVQEQMEQAQSRLAKLSGDAPGSDGVTSH